MAKVLFLASWYPGRVDPFDGDFIERHAKSISLFNQVFVIYVVKDPGIKNGKTEIEKSVAGNLISYKAYYPYSGSKISWVEKLHSNRCSFILHRRIFKMILDDYGMPDIVHLNVLMKSGIFAWWLKKKYQLPYVLSENWTGYYKERKHGYQQQSWLYKFLSRKVYTNCVYALPVTTDLGEKMNALLGEIPFRVIPNVVDTTRFYPDLQHKNSKTRLIHVSTLGYHKNIEGILEVTEKLYQARQDFELYLVGPASDHILKWAEDRGLTNKCIFFIGQINYQNVAEHLRNADAMIMFSRYENLPCVILEALTCGLPVISTDVGGIREVINSDNGILIPSENKNDLLNAMNRLLNEMHLFDRQKVADAARDKFSYDVVGHQFDKVYKEILSHKHSPA